MKLPPSDKRGAAPTEFEDSDTRDIFTHAPIRMAQIVFTVAILFAAWNLSSRPVYRSSVKVRVDDVAARSPQIEHRSIPTGTIDEGEALTILKSRELVARVVAPLGQSDRPRSDGDTAIELGLTTWVTDESAPPLSRMLNSVTKPFEPSFQLAAQAVAKNPSAPRTVRVRFIDRQTVSVSRIGSKDGEETTLSLNEDGSPINYDGLALVLQPQGLTDGRDWRIESLTEDEAIDRVLARLRVDKQQHQTGTLGLTVLDEDPVRAAAIAGSIAAAFVEQDVLVARARAEKTVSFLKGELESRQTKLDELNLAEVELQIQHTDTIDPEFSSTELIKRESSWDSAHRTARAHRLGAERALSIIDSGEPMRGALASLDGSLPGEVLSLVKALDDEEFNLRKVFRGSEDTGYRRTLLLKADDYTLEAEKFRTRVADLEDIVAKLEAGDMSALSRLGGDLARDGSIAVDWNIRLWMTELEKKRSDVASLQSDFKDTYPPLVAAHERIETLRTQILGGVRGLLEGHQATLEQKVAYGKSWREIEAKYPDAEAELIRASIAQVKREILDTFKGYASGLRLAEDQALLEVKRIQTRLGRLAKGRQELKSTQLEAEQLALVVGDLMRDVENAEVAAAGILPSARIMDAAVVPRAPLKPRAAFGVVAGVVLGLLCALVWAWFDIQRTEPFLAQVMSEALGPIRPDIPVCGRVAVTGPTDGESRGASLRRRRKKSGPWIPLMSDPESPAAQTYRTLRAQLRSRKSRSGTVPKLIGLTGQTPGEGVSTVAINLAMARAQLGEKVLIVDGHFARPVLREALVTAGLEPKDHFGDDSIGSLDKRRSAAQSSKSRGLAECLSGSAHWSEVAASTGFPGLDALDAGRSDVVSTDLFASEMFNLFADETSAVYDLVIIDFPAMSERPDAETAARALDGMLLITSEARPSAQSVTDDCIGRLTSSGGHVLGIVRTIAMERRRSTRADASTPPSPRKAG